MSRYKMYEHSNEIIVVSTFAGKPVRGIAKCDPKDNFNEEVGLTLARMRCDEKIAIKRMKRAQVKLDQALVEYEAAAARLNKMIDYCDNSVAEYERVSADLEHYEGMI